MEMVIARVEKQGPALARLVDDPLEAAGVVAVPTELPRGHPRCGHGARI